MRFSMVTEDTGAFASGLSQAVGLALGDAVVTEAQQTSGELGIGGNYTKQNDIMTNPGLLNPLVINTYVSLVQSGHSFYLLCNLTIIDFQRNYAMIAANTIFVPGTPTVISSTLITQENRIFAL